MMDLIGKIKDSGQITREELKIFTILLNLFAPHVTSEMWETMGFEGNINFVEWPKYDESLISSEFKEIVVQINGKVRDTFLIDSDLNDEELIRKSKEQPKIKELIKNKKIIKEICARNKLVNLVIN